MIDLMQERTPHPARSVSECPTRPQSPMGEFLVVVVTACTFPHLNALGAVATPSGRLRCWRDSLEKNSARIPLLCAGSAEK